jgi:hypothetical protein
VKSFRPILLALIIVSNLQAQDTFFTLAKAPLTITRDAQTEDFTFTNNSGKPLIRIKVTSAHRGLNRTVVIFDELGPHKTVTYDISKSLVAGADYREAVITCAKYSQPIKLAQY